jgi:biopolymer transport protein ExbD
MAEEAMTADQWYEEQLDEEPRRQKRERERREDKDSAMNINSLMDIMVIILVFLLKSYGDEPLKTVGQDLKVPMSSAQLTPEDMTSITISQKAILINDKKVVDVKQGAVDRSMKRDGADGLLIQKLFDDIKKESEKKKREMDLLGKKYEPVATIIADQSVPYRLVTEVMYTAGQAKLTKFKFAVIKTTRDSLGK